ncbi:MAG: methylmalonyl-CoA mutase, partial [Alphaproteobacteria bacterium]
VPARAEPLPRRRPAEAFETLRNVSDAHLEKSGKRPIVFLATVGGPAQYSVAETYARNLLAAGGIEAISANGAYDAAAAAKAFRASGTDVAVICSDDTGYGEHGAEMAGMLAGAGARAVYVAGPAEAHDRLGPFVKGYMYDGCDVLTILQDILRAKGISK